MCNSIFWTTQYLFLRVFSQLNNKIKCIILHLIVKYNYNKKLVKNQNYSLFTINQIICNKANFSSASSLALTWETTFSASELL